MMSLERMMVIGLGSVAMLLSMLLRKKQFPDVAVWKMVLVTLLLTVMGVAGTLILAYIEMGKFGGTSFYGAVLLVPLFMLPAILIKISYKDILNLSAPAECAMLFVMRFECLKAGCCFGRYLPKLGFQFPNQIAEMVVSITIMIVLIQMHKKDRQVQLYPWFMILYGVCRSVLQCFRYGGLEPWFLGLSQSHVWSLLSIVIGIAWLLLGKARKSAAK